MLAAILRPALPWLLSCSGSLPTGVWDTGVLRFCKPAVSPIWFFRPSRLLLALLFFFLLTDVYISTDRWRFLRTEGEVWGLGESWARAVWGVSTPDSQEEIDGRECEMQVMLEVISMIGCHCHELNDGRGNCRKVNSGLFMLMLVDGPSAVPGVSVEEINDYPSPNTLPLRLLPYGRALVSAHRYVAVIILFLYNNRTHTVYTKKMVLK